MICFDKLFLIAKCSTLCHFDMELILHLNSWIKKKDCSYCILPI